MELLLATGDPQYADAVRDLLPQVEERFSFIAGGIVPGVLVLSPDFPENKENWPFFWGENEYVITLGGSWLFLANAADALLVG